MARWLRWAYAVAVAAWLLLLVPSIVWWRESVPWLVFMSWYANWVGSIGAWQAARAEQASNGRQT